MSIFPRFFRLISALLLLANVVSAQTRLIEKVTKKGADLVIPYEKYVLSNGLTVLVHEDHSDPVVHVDVTYHVGSSRETYGRSGFAHFFEHMMFQGSEHVADEQHFKIITQAGGTLNGTTTADRTNYFETLPSNYLETALWLEADRMGFLLDSVTPAKFEVQRATVKNERGQNVDNRPYGRVNEKIGEALYPAGNPYSWPTIGWIEDLNKADLNDLKQFFLRWYAPNNAVLTIAGDVRVADAVKMVEKYFGPIRRSPEVHNVDKIQVQLDKDRYISYEDNIRFPLLQFAFPAVPSRHPDEPALDLLADILGGGSTSILYQNFVKTQKALSATASNPTMELAGQFSVAVRTYPDTPLADMEKLVREAFSEFEKRGVTDDDLIRFKVGHEARTINSLASVSGKASLLASYQTFTGNPNYIGEEMNTYMHVTKEDVMRVYNQYLKNKPAVILSVYPKGKAMLKAAEDNFTPQKNNAAPQADSITGTLLYNKPGDLFDRNKQPAPGPNPVIKVPAYWKKKFTNGLQVIGVYSPELPVVDMRLYIEGGHKAEAKDKAGVAYLLSDLMMEGTQKYTAEEITRRLERLGSSINIAAGNQYISISVSSLTKHIDSTLALLEEILFLPRMDEKDFERLKKEQLEAIANQTTSAAVVATNVYNKLLYGDNHIFSIPVMGTAESVSRLTLQDIKSFYAAQFSPTVSSVVVTGDIAKSDILKKINFLLTWPGKSLALPQEPAVSSIKKTKIYWVNKENSPQSEIRIGYLALRYDATGDYYKAKLMNYVLGGSFNSRINLNLREAKGFTYGARSSFSGDKWTGPFTASAGVRINATDSAVVEFIKEIRQYRDSGITAQELAFTKSSIGQADALRYETPSQKATFLKQMLDYNLGKSFVDAQNSILQKIRKEEIDALAKKYLPADSMIIVVVGDQKIIREPLAKLGYELVELDKDGHVIGQ